METKTIKISKKNYEWLYEEAGKLQAKERKSISIDKTLTYISKKMKKRLSDITGSWRMTDKEVKTFMEDLEKGWKKWRIGSV